MQKCDRTSHVQKRAARAHIPHTFQNGFRTHTHTCDRTSHVCVRARTFATHSLVSGSIYMNQFKCYKHFFCYFNALKRYGLRRCVRARTRAMCGRTCVCACEMNSETSVRSVCVRAFFPLVTPTHVRPHTFLTFQGKLMDISDFICEL